MLPPAYETRQDSAGSKPLRPRNPSNSGRQAIVNNDRYRLFFKGTSAIAAILDRDGNVEDLSDAAREISGSPASAGGPVWDLPIWRGKARDILRGGIEAAVGGQEWRRELPARTPEQRDIALEVTLMPLGNSSDGAQALMFEARPAGLEESISLADLADLAAHDFNNMLAGIAGNLELVARQEHDATASTRIKRALRVVFRGRALTSLLDVFARTDRKVGPVDYAAELHSSLEYCQTGLETDFDVATDIDPGLWPCRADRDYVSAALLHLGIHVHDAAPRDGRILVRARNLPAGTRDPAATAVQSDEDYVVTEFAVETPGRKQEATRAAIAVRRDANLGFGLRIVRSFAREFGGDLVIGDSRYPELVARLYLRRESESG